MFVYLLHNGQSSEEEEEEEDCNCITHLYVQ